MTLQAQWSSGLGEFNAVNRGVYIADNLDFLRSLNSECIDLVIIDPPFGKNQTFSGRLKPPLTEKEREVESSLLESWGITDIDGAYDRGIEYPDQEGQTAKFSDIWRFERVLDEDWWESEQQSDSAVYWLIESTRRTHGNATAAYIAFMARRMAEIWRVLKPTGSVYLHCDHAANAYLRQMMDAVFDRSNFRREIVWNLKTASGYKTSTDNFVRSHETILYYRKDRSGGVFNKTYSDYSEKYMSRFRKSDEQGRRYRDDRGGGRRQYLDESPGIPMTDVWDDIMPFQQHSSSPEVTGYPTQKPQALARRMIEASSNPDDIVLDCFAGCAYVPVAAEELGRRWVACDMSPRAWTVVRRQFAKKPDLSMTVAGDEDDYDDASPSFDGNGALRVFGPIQLPERDPADLDNGITRQGSNLAPIGFRQSTVETSDEIWTAFVEAWDTFCWYCGVKKAEDRRELHLDHVEPNARDGSNDDCWNRALACAPCNSDKGNRLTPQETIDKAYEDGRIRTPQLRDEMMEQFAKRHSWAKERYEGLDKETNSPPTTPAHATKMAT